MLHWLTRDNGSPSFYRRLQSLPIISAVDSGLLDKNTVGAPGISSHPPTTHRNNGYQRNDAPTVGSGYPPYELAAHSLYAEDGPTGGHFSYWRRHNAEYASLGCRAVTSGG